ncbi:MAG: DUF2069 domain-containing protein [Gammaproteobacteria bacterium]|nr:DUF2069 domain-containing protein [Rhodocyclaceae bacterium]MBU3910452.1 DUF2069 domain-containing protein [Gammaproteobacteria bacterium]MBU3987822.1 DUF2069 domain-containing protein [Gammaproteobacteria bacterium]MBU4004933.1 DUF2069 domain-containing protein [Gammaproteobacteria bacterium]MBU4020526.1 DUF2069 domain-containing protein [Gammaproteobacteria bacterium]
MAIFDVAHSRPCNFAAITSLLLLIALCLAWELWLAPLRPGGSWLALKALPLLAPLFGILHARRYTHQWASLLILLYLLEGLTRAFSDNGMMQLLAIVEVVLALVFFMATLCFARATAPQNIKAGD